MKRIRSGLTIGLVIAGAGAIALTAGLSLAANALSSAMCRGADCIDWTASTTDGGPTASVVDRCFYLGSPTGISIFNQRRFGRAARELLAAEYVFLGREFLFIESHDRSAPIIVVDANRYLIDFPPPTSAFCNRGETRLTFDRLERRITVRPEGEGGLATGEAVP